MGAEPLGTVPVVLAVADDDETALAAALDETGAPGWPVDASIATVAAADRAAAADPSSAPRLVASLLADRGPGAPPHVIAPPSLVAALIRPGPGWTEVVVAPPAERIRRVVVPRALADCPFVLAIDVAANGPRAIAALARHAHPRRTPAARFAPASLALAAEIALAFGPRLVLLLAEEDGRSLAIATPDLIVAELVNLALAPAADVGPGPWEDPLVQRATELDLGVRIPAQLFLIPITPTGGPGTARTLDRLANRLRDRLGIPGAPSPRPHER